MEEGSGGGAGGAAAASSSSSSTLLCGGGRQRFEVELRPGETTIVSWKKLMKDANKAAKNNIENKAPPVSAPPAPVPVVANPALDSRIAPPSGDAAENEAGDAPPGSRFSAVIEKIERLYMGKNSSDEEDLNDVPDDDEYDTEDSFIDDTELDEYFQVDNSAIKHDGFFVNRGKLERTNEPAVLPTEQQPKKRRRKDVTKGDGGSNDGNVPNKHMKVNKKESRKVVAPIDKNTPTPSRSIISPPVNCDDVKYQSPIIALGTVVKKPSDPKNIMDPSPLKILDGEARVKQKAGLLQSKKHATKLKDGSPSPALSNQRVNEKGIDVQLKSHGKLVNSLEEVNQSVLPREKSATHQQVDMKPSETPQQPKNAHMARKEGSSTKPKSTNLMLEKAIRDLEKIVAETRPPSMEVPEADNSSQAVKRRMPPEIKQKLAKVARLAHAIHGKLSKELLNRLMSILGHLIQVRSLKRNIQNMVTTALSVKKEKDARVQQLKKEVDDMVKTRAPMMKPQVIEQEAGSSDDFQETSSKEKAVKSKFITDDALEDKICELYDFYVEGLDEDAGPQVRKLYAELAELWPKGCMDNHGIKRAICRAKDRRKALYRRKDQENSKRKKLLVSKSDTISVEAGSTGLTQHAPAPDKLITDSTAPIRSITTTLVTNAATRPPSSSNNPTTDRPKHEKLKANSNNQTTAPTAWELVNKKVKKKHETKVDDQTQLEKKSYKETTSTLVKATTPESVTPAPESVIPAQPTVNKPADMA